MSPCLLFYMEVKYGVHSVSKTTLDGRSIQQRPCMHNSVKTYKVHRISPNNACRAEIGRFPILIQIQKRALHFIDHLKMSLTNSLQLIQPRAQPRKVSPQSVLNLSSLTLTPTNTNQLQISTASQLPIRVKQIIKHTKNSYWNKETQSQNKLNLYRALNRVYKVETDPDQVQAH